MVASVHQAVRELLAEAGPGAFTLTDVARRAEVNPTSIYRRWGSLEAVLLDVETARLSDTSPVPDTGTLRGDLLGYAHTAAADIARPGGLAFLQALIGAHDLTDEQRSTLLLQRASQFQTMLDRGRDRDEPPLDYTVVMDCILAPIYLRILSGQGVDESALASFVDRALASTPQPTAHRS